MLEIRMVENTLDKDGQLIDSTEIREISEKAYRSELSVYKVDPEKFSQEEFKKGFLGNNKMNVPLPDSYPKLPLEPANIIMLSNSIMVFEYEKETVGYFSILCFAEREEGKLANIYFRFAAGFEEKWRNQGIFHEPALEQMLRMLKAFKYDHPNQNPMINIVQFAMVSAATPGAIVNLAKILECTGLTLPPLSFRNQKATDLAIMMGLGKLINPKTGISDIGLCVREQTLNPNDKNSAVGFFDRYNPEGKTKGSGVSGLQQICPLETFLQKENEINLLIQVFVKHKSALRAKL